MLKIYSLPSKILTGKVRGIFVGGKEMKGLSWLNLTAKACLS